MKGQTTHDDRPADLLFLNESTKVHHKRCKQQETINLPCNKFTLSLYSMCSMEHLTIFEIIADNPVRSSIHNRGRLQPSGAPQLSTRRAAAGRPRNSSPECQPRLQTAPVYGRTVLPIPQRGRVAKARPRTRGLTGSPTGASDRRGSANGQSANTPRCERRRAVGSLCIGYKVILHDTWA